jgi:Ca2+-binding EF-hand superfamily protein
MRKIFCGMALSAMVLMVGFTRADEDEDAPKKGLKLDGRLLDKLFDKMDADGDGKVSKEEFKKFFAQLGQKRLGGKGKLGKGRLAGRLFDKLDSDGDGFLTKEEFKKLPEVRQQIGPLLEMLKERLGKNKKDDDD